MCIYIPADTFALILHGRRSCVAHSPDDDAWAARKLKLGMLAVSGHSRLPLLPCPALPAPALNVHTLATLHNNKEAEMGALLFWQYLAACVTLPAALSCFLWLLNTPAMST